MPNWCSNSIEISGETEKIDRIRTILSLREDNNDMFFKPLLGQTDDENWYDDNINNLGTKWDVSVSKDNFYTESEDEIGFNCESAWSPPVAGMVNVCKKYGVSCIISYEEPGNDFYGRTKMDSSGILSEEDYEYREGKYRLDPDYFWESCEFDIEYDVEDLDDTYSVDDLIKDTYSFLDEDDKVEMKRLIVEHLGEE